MSSKIATYNLGKQVAIVLGSGVNADGTPWLATRLRAVAAAKLALEHKDTIVICSGAGLRHAHDWQAPTEARVLADLIWQQGVPARRLLCEPESVDTLGNAVLSSARYFYKQKPRPVTVVTSPFHAERAEIAFRGVLGPTWPLVVHTCDPAPDNDYRATTEIGGIAWMHQFFEPVTPGDLPQITKRLFEIGKPYYKTLPILNRLAAKAA